MENGDEGSMTKAFRSLSDGNADAMQQLWERYFRAAGQARSFAITKSATCSLRR